MRKTIILFALLLMTLTVFASVVYYGDQKAVFLENTLELKSGYQLVGDGSGSGMGLSGFLDMNSNKITELATPTASTDAVTKQYADDLGYGWPLMAKGSLVTSNGTANGEFTACSNDQILVWDSAETSGIKCANQSAGTAVHAHYSSVTLNPSAGSAQILNYSTSVRDTNSTVTTGASWKFEPSSNGVYTISCSFETQIDLDAVGEFLDIQIFKNGSGATRRHVITALTADSTGNQYQTVHTTASLYLLTTDDIDCRTNRTAGITIANGFGDFTAVKVGD